MSRKIDFRTEALEFGMVDLAGLETLHLNNRQDSKFSFNISLLQAILDEMKPFYDILEVEGNRYFLYKTTYYDTPTLSLYLDHHNGKLDRYKIRIRSYEESGISYFEVKAKSNKQRTIKDRVIAKEYNGVLKEEFKNLVLQKTPFSPDDLKPTLGISYNRMTFVDKERTEKVTIDVNLGFSRDGLSKDMDGLVISELKQDRYNPKSKFLNILRQQKISEVSVSKYCLGIMSFHEDIKHNRFKARLKTIKSMLNGNN